MSRRYYRGREEEAVSPVIATILMVAITVVLAGTLYVWAASLAESNTDGSLSLYTFDAKEALGTPTEATDDNLAIITMNQGQDTTWAVLSVKLSINGAASTTCAVPGQTGGSCVVVDSSNDASMWSVGEDVTVLENGADLCSDSNCEMTFSITNVRTGQSLAKTSTGSSLDAYTTPDNSDGDVSDIQDSITIQGTSVLYSSQIDIAGFQIVHDDCINLDTAITETAFTLTNSQDVVIAVSLTGSTMSAGSGTLLEEVGQITDDCILDYILVDSIGNIIDSGANIDYTAVTTVSNTVMIIDAILSGNAHEETNTDFDLNQDGNINVFDVIISLNQIVEDNSNSDVCLADSDCMAGGYCMNGACVYDDQDMDGVSDSQDNCPQNANADQADADQDDTGDSCDSTPFGPLTTYYLDADGDTYGDASQTTEAYDQPSGYVTNANDCDDNDNTLGDITNDADCDGVITPSDCDDGDNTLGDIQDDADCDGVVTADDCDDYDATVYMLNSEGNCAPEPTYTVVGLDQTSGVNIVGGNYVFNDGVTYDPYLQYGLGTGTFVLTGIPTNHPFAILNYGSSDIQYTGDSTTQSTEFVDGVTYDFFYGDVTITVTGNFGTVSVYCPYHGYMGGENLFVYDSQYDIADTTPPVITVLGNNPVTIEVGSTYIDAGATADGGEIVTSSGTVDTNTVGAYTITYSATDSSGNQGTATRTVYVVDTNAPVITVLGDNPATVELGSTYSDAGATADGGETVTTSGTVDTNTVGVYTITYTATDSSGNQGIATRTVNVVDTTAPVITVLGNDPETVEVGSTYTDAGATADGGETVTSSGTVDTNTVGDYTITYTATDSSNNAATATRTVNVVDTTAPVMTLVGSNPIDVEAATTYTDAGATAQDNYDGDITSSITTTNNIDMNTVGTYSVIYNVVDANGNSAVPLIRTVNVVDTTAPVITIIGSNPVDIQVGSVYNDAGATAADTLDGDLSSSITVVNNVDTNTVGTYTVTYDVTDSAGNQATQAVRTVNVNSAPNTPPSVDSVSLSTSSSDGLVYSDVTLTCSSTVSDADGDAVTTSTTWTADGNQIGTGSSITLTTTLVDIGDSVFCTVTPNDGTTDGSSVSSTAVTVSNYAPTINSVTIDNTSPTVGDTLTCSATSSDTEGHSLTTTYTWYVNSVEQSPTSPTFDTTGLSDNDVIYCSARVEDTYGAAAVQQSSTVTVTASSGPTTHYIDIVNFAFSPSSITISVGDTIIWTNYDSSSHTVTSDDGLFNSGGISQSNTWSYTFTSAGTFGYHCSPHPGMTGTVIVQ